MAEICEDMGFTLTAGWIEQARRVASPNFGPRPPACAPELLVIHNISLPPGCYGGDCIERLFRNCLDWDEHPFFAEIRGAEVSSHLLIRRCGELVQFVDLRERAWHAGQSCFQGRDCCNDFSIGIELEGSDDQPFTDIQYTALGKVTKEIMRLYPGITPDRITSHAAIAPGRKTDPGPMFDWQRYIGSIQSAG